MRISISPAPALLALAIAALGCTGVQAATHSLTSQTFVLKRSDVPSTFNSKANFSRLITNAAAVSRYGVKQVTLTKEGRVDGYESGFSRQYNANHTPLGVYGVTDEVTQFSSTAGAHWWFQRVKKTTYRGGLSDEPRVGDERVAVVSHPLKGNSAARVTFRHGDFVVTVSTSSIGTVDPLPAAIHYAHVIDHRLTAHSQ